MEAPNQSSTNYQRSAQVEKPWFLLTTLLLITINFIIDVITSISALSLPLIILTIFEILIIGLNIKAIKGSIVAYMVLFAFFFIRSFNFYFDDFTIWTRSGYELSITLNHLGINLIPLVITISFMIHSFKKFGKRKAQNPVALLAALIFLLVIVGIFGGS